MFKAHRWLYHSTLGSRVIKNKKKGGERHHDVCSHHGPEGPRGKGREGLMEGHELVEFKMEFLTNCVSVQRAPVTLRL